MAIEGLKRIWEIRLINREYEKKFYPKNKKDQKKIDKDEKKEESKINIKI